MTIDYEVYKLEQAITDCLEFQEERKEEIFQDLRSNYSDEVARKKAQAQVLKEMQDTLDCLKMEKENKIDSLVQAYKDISYLKTNIEDEIKALKGRIDALVTRQENISYALEYFTKGENFESAKAKISYRKSDVADIISIDDLPTAYKAVEMKVPVTELPAGMEEYIKQYVPDKTAIKKAIKEKIKEAQENGEGEEIIEALANAYVPGARLIFKNNMTIK